GAMRDPGKVNAIAAYQKHPEQSVRLAAAISLGKIPHKVAMLRLMDSLEDEEATVRGAAVLQLAGVANGDIAFDLLTDAAASRDVPERRRLYALEALARYFDTVMADNKLKAESRRTKQQKQAFKLGKRLLNDSAGEGWNIRGHAVKLVASCDHPDAKKFLEKYEQQEKHPFVLGKIKQALVAE
ncbi:MAG: HEAT repeat domain-containing protein, partial [Candidatus Coatesbacteria bacterium]|nr:HEAT repeat domain-containing protein [Candidatus Coatesbacteria bacterium]